MSLRLVQLQCLMGMVQSNEIGLTASAAASANLQSLFNNANTSGSWAGDIAKVYTINSGTTMGILTAPASMGGTLVINNSGNIQGGRWYCEWRCWCHSHDGSIYWNYN